MAKIFEGLPADFCIPDCPLMELSVEMTCLFAGDEIYLRKNTISCVHEPVCKMRAEAGNNSKTALWIMHWGEDDRGILKTIVKCSNCSHTIFSAFGGDPDAANQRKRYENLDLPEICPVCNCKMKGREKNV